MSANVKLAGGDKTALRPFHVNVPEADLTELRRRIKATRFPERETVADFSQGVPAATTEKLARYWATEYDWCEVEARMNAYPQFITEIDGLDIHFIHVRSKHENALPLIINHGWPGSITHKLKMIEPLTDPTAHGGKASDAFHVVIPSMPGYGFSGKPTATGWRPERIARAWAVLMETPRVQALRGAGWRLGRDHRGHHGDAGTSGNDRYSHQHARRCSGRHRRSGFHWCSGSGRFSADEKEAYDERVFVYKHVAYASYMGSRPQTLTGLADSPVALANFMIDFDAKGLELIARSFDGQREALTPDDVLDNVTLFWLTNTGVSAARLYWENKLPLFHSRETSPSRLR